MISHWHHAFSVGLLALYLLVLARWHGGRAPRVVSGPADFALLISGIGGLALFGPLGQTLAAILFDRPNTLDWLSLASGMTLAVLLLSRRAWRRLVIYQIDAATLDRALEDALAHEPGRFLRTLRGFEDPVYGQGVQVDMSPRWRTATIEAYGREPERLIHGLERHLEHRFRSVNLPPSRISGLFLVGAVLTLMVATVGWLFSQPQGWADFRGLLERLPGG